MCSMGVFLGVWLFIFMNDISTCRGVFERRRTRSVSVVIFRGMRLSTTMRSGRMSCRVAREWSMTKMFSFFSSSMAGSRSGKFRGMVDGLI